MDFCIKNNTLNFSDCQSEVESQFQERKENSLILSDIYHDLGMFSKSYRVGNCGSFLEFHVSPDSVKLNKANFCKDRLCPMCNWRRSLKIFSQVSKVMDDLQKSGFRFLFLTLTLRNCQFDELGKTVDVMFSGWRKLYRSKKLKNVIYGSFHALEITVNEKANTFHPHLHCLLAVKESYFHKGYLTQRKWSELWGEFIDSDYIPVLHIETVKSGKFDAETKGRTFYSATKEISKYIAKGSDYLSGTYAENILRVQYLSEGIHGRRICSFTGVFKESAKKLKLDDLETGNLVQYENIENNELAYVVYRYRWIAGIYVLDPDRQGKPVPEVIRSGCLPATV